MEVSVNKWKNRKSLTPDGWKKRSEFEGLVDRLEQALIASRSQQSTHCADASFNRYFKRVRKYYDLALFYQKYVYSAVTPKGRRAFRKRKLMEFLTVPSLLIFGGPAMFNVLFFLSCYYPEYYKATISAAYPTVSVVDWWVFFVITALTLLYALCEYVV